MPTDLNVKLEGAEYNSAVLELLIKTLAMQQATATTLIEMISKSDEEADEFMDLLNVSYGKYSTSILHSLYEHRGKIDLNDILDK